MNIQTRMAWQDFLTDEEQAELDAAEAAWAKAQESIQPVKSERDTIRRKLKIRCDMRAHRAREDKPNDQDHD